MGTSARLSAFRLFFSGLASITVATVLAWLLGAANGSGRFALAALAMSTIAIATAWRLARLRPRASTADSSSARRPAAAGLIGPVSLLLLMFVLSLAISGFSKLEPYYVSYHWQGRGGTIIIAASLGFAFLQPLWFVAIRRLGFLATLCVAITLLAAAALGFTLSEATGYYSQAGFAFAFGAANGGISTTLWASFAEAVSARRSTATAFAFALLTATSKFGLAAASLAIAAWLSVVHYRVADAGLDAVMAGFAMFGAVVSLAILALSFARNRKGSSAT